MNRYFRVCVGLGGIVLGVNSYAQSTVGTFNSTVTIQGPVKQTATGSNVKQDLNVGSAQKSQANTFTSVVTTGSITQTGNNGAQQFINVGGMNNSKANKFDAHVTTGNIEQVANRGERQELDIGSVTNSTVTGTATTRVSVSSVKQTGEGEIALGAVKNSNVGQFQSSLTVQGKLEGNNIRMGSVVGQERYNNRGRYVGREETGGEPSVAFQMPDFGTIGSADSNSELTKHRLPSDGKTVANGSVMDKPGLILLPPAGGDEYLRQKLCKQELSGEGSTNERHDVLCSERVKAYKIQEDRFNKLALKIRNGATDPQVYKDFAQVLVDLAPIVGSASAVYELITGETMVSGEEASRALAALGIVASVVPGGKLSLRFIDDVFDAKKVAKFNKNTKGLREESSDLNTRELERVKHEYNRAILKGADDPFHRFSDRSIKSVAGPRGSNLIAMVRIKPSGKGDYYRRDSNKELYGNKSLQKEIQENLPVGDKIEFFKDKNPKIFHADGSFTNLVWHHSPNHISTVSLIPKRVHGGKADDSIGGGLKNLHYDGKKGGEDLYNTTSTRKY